jgi:steroid delta-isomerase-like uncharacterized protein
MAETDTAEQPKPRTRRPPRRKRNEELIRRYFDAVARRDPEGMGECCTEDVVEEQVPLRILRGKDELVSGYRELFAAVPDLETTVSRVVADDRHAVVEWRMSGTFSGGLYEGLEPTGRRIELRGLDLFEIEDELIKTNTAYFDGMAFARGAGLLPAQDSGAERAMKSALNTVTRLRRAVNERMGS